MKKVSLILLLVILATVFLTAQTTNMKLVRLTFINKSGHTIYVKLEGKTQDQFYYLTIPYGTREIPDDVTFTVTQDIYTRTMWYGPGDFECEGFSSKGELWAVMHAKFVFTPCGFPAPNKGEPTWGEKIVYYKYIDAYGTAGGANCYWTVKTRTYKSPTGSCFFLWKY
jgi:hypothetical protein